MPSLSVDHFSEEEFALAGSRGNRLTIGCCEPLCLYSLQLMYSLTLCTCGASSSFQQWINQHQLPTKANIWHAQETPSWGQKIKLIYRLEITYQLLKHSVCLCANTACLSLITENQCPLSYFTHFCFVCHCLTYDLRATPLGEQICEFEPQRSPLSSDSDKVTIAKKACWEQWTFRAETVAMWEFLSGEIKKYHTFMSA